MFLTVLLGMAALVLDVGSWYRAQRSLQATADAAALAGAQALPESPGSAASLAQAYVAKNGGGSATVSFSRKLVPNDVVTVSVHAPQPGLFSKIFGLSSVNVGAHAAARSATPRQALHVAPITIGSDNPQLRCGAPCYGQPTNLIALPTGNNSGNMTNFQLVDLSSHGGRVSSSLVSGWLRTGYDQYLSLGSYSGVASTTFNSPEFRQAMTDMRGKEIIVLIHPSAGGNEGQAGAQYTEVGWAGFVIQQFSGSGAQGTLTGYFTRVNIQGIATSNPGQLFYGARTISLID
ncbi:MAG: pilus assembly protein TadG-related protein [Actinomycetota bacterium]|nr:pilus assembly protein TadG-related protein [Actinomycetota bacterium]